VNIEQLLARLARDQVQIYLDRDRLRYRAPEGVLTPEMRSVTGRNRMVAIEYLRSVSEPAPSLSGKCATCDRRDWVDHPPEDGRIRTTCGRCGRFIGYRPENS